jgi:hypothetical protein
VLLARLSAHRDLDIGALARRAEVPEPELQSVFDGLVPSPSLLRQRQGLREPERPDLVAAAHGPIRFTGLKRGEGISRRMLTLTLRNLGRDGLVTRTAHPTVPPKVSTH